MGQCCSKNPALQEGQLENGVVKIQAQFRGAKTRKKLKEEHKMPEKENSNTKPIERQPSFVSEHMPSPDFAVPVDQIPIPKNPGLKMIMERKGSFKFDQDDPELESLPYLGPHKLKNDVIYEGQWKKGKRHGRGKQVWKEGIVFEGYFVDDKANGKGRLIHQNGEVYEGDWVDGLAEGKGELFQLDGSWYEGDFKKDKQVTPNHSFGESRNLRVGRLRTRNMARWSEI